jgi:hypothetical protein
LVADCLARERRENTLELLLLTHLTACDIVLAKSCVHTLRVLLLVGAALPMLWLPLILGGVSLTEITIAYLLDFSVLCLSLAAGLVVSSLTQRCATAMPLAVLAGVASSLLFSLLYLGLFYCCLAPKLPGFSFPEAWSLPGVSFVYWQLIADFQGVWQTVLAAAPSGGAQLWLGLLWLLGTLSLFVTVLAWRIAGAQLRHSSVDRPTAWRWWSITSAPRLRPAFLRRQRQRERDRNPILWLQRYSWTDCAARWGWVLFVIAAELSINALRWPTYQFAGQVILSLVLLFAVAFSAVMSWRWERHTGMWELLMVAPLSLWLMVRGRVFALYRQFLIPGLVWVGGLWLISPAPFISGDYFYLALWAAATFLVLPWAGQNLALNSPGPWTAWLATVIPVIFLPGGLYSNTSNYTWKLIILPGLMLPGLVAFLDLRLIPAKAVLTAKILGLDICAASPLMHSSECNSFVQSRIGRLLLLIREGRPGKMTFPE